jgi:chitosanase
MLTPTQKKTAESIVNLFETDEVLGDYSKVTLIAGDTGHLTFGRSQTTLGSGNLYELVRRYCDNGGARFGARLAPWLPRLEASDRDLDDDLKLQNLLRASADDPVMRDSQDAFFDEFYWQPAASAAEREGITSALGVAVVYDSHVQGSWLRMRTRTNAEVGKLTAAGEQQWLQAYVATRRAWLASNTNKALRPTVYRMDAFRRLMDQGYWDLELPLVVRDKEISQNSLSGLPPHCYAGPQPGTRPLALESPLPRGLDVRLVQLGLSDRGIDVKADGIFGRTTMSLIREYQAAQGLPVTDVADVNLIVQLTA